MRAFVLLASLIALAVPAAASAQARPPALLGSTAATFDLPAPAPLRLVGSNAVDAWPPTPSASGGQEARRPSIVQHLGLGALAGVVVGSALSVAAGADCEECVIAVEPGFAATGAILGAIVGLVIWNIRVSS